MEIDKQTDGQGRRKRLIYSRIQKDLRRSSHSDKNSESLCCTPETNIMLNVNCTSIKKKKNPTGKDGRSTRVKTSSFCNHHTLAWLMKLEQWMLNWREGVPIQNSKLA